MTIGRPRLAVTGIGMVTGLGLDTETTLRRILGGETAISPIADVVHRCTLDPLVAEVPASEAERQSLTWGHAAESTASERYAELAAREAIANAGLSGVAVELVLGASTGATREGVAESAARSDQSVLPLVSRLTTQSIGATGRRLAAALGSVRSSTVLCSACSSGALAIAIGAMRLEQGCVWPQLVGGTDSINLLTLSGFESLGAMSATPCRPFDEQHCGLNLGEGAGFLILETEAMVVRRGGNVLVWLDGYAVGAEAHHLTHPEPAGRRAAALVASALRRAGLLPRDIGYVNAHGTATIANDEMESRVLHLVFGDKLEKVYVSSSKSQIGHTLAAAGAIEAAITARAIIERTLPPTCGLSQPADTCQLRHVVKALGHADLQAALSNSFGFGGACAVLAMRRRDEVSGRESMVQSAEATERRVEPIFVTGLLTLGSAGILHGQDNAAWLDSECGSSRADLPFEPLDLLVMERSRRFDRLTAMTTIGCSFLMSDAGLSCVCESGSLEPDGVSDGFEEPVGLVLGNALGPVGRSADFVQRILNRGSRGANPAEFPHLLPSSPSGNASIYAQLHGPVFNVSDVGPTIQAAMDLGMSCIRAGSARAMLVGTTECRDDAIVAAQQQGMLIGSYPADANDGSAWLLLEGESSAIGRGAPDCELVIAGWYSDLVAAQRPLPSPVADSIALWGIGQGVERESEVVLEQLGWSGVTMRTRLPRAFDGWTHPGFVLAAGAALVCAGVCTSILVVTDSSRGMHCAVFRRMTMPKREAGVD